jgi:hypothetical protein
VSRLSAPRLLALGGLAFALSACDAADPASDLADADLDDAAVVVASALALDSGGALEDAAASASLAGSLDAAGRTAGPDRPGCENSRDFDEATSTWTVSIDCERGDPDGRRYASFERLSTYQFLDADGNAQRERRGAQGVEYDVLSGETLFQSPRGVHAVTALEADLSATRLDSDLVSVSGTYSRAGADTLRSRRGERTVTYDLALALDDVQGPKTRVRRWRQAVAGTITGSIQATITRTPTDGETTTVEIDREFEVTFQTDGSGGRIAQIALGGRRYQADVGTGEVIGLP